MKLLEHISDMALLTPPPTVAETAGFFKPFISDPVYYEDIYGTRNPDGELEELDAPDDCESDSDSEDEEALWQEGGGFSSFPSTYPSPAEPQKPVTDQGMWHDHLGSLVSDG